MLGMHAQSLIDRMKAYWRQPNVTVWFRLPWWVFAAGLGIFWGYFGLLFIATIALVPLGLFVVDPTIMDYRMWALDAVVFAGSIVGSIVGLGVTAELNKSIWAANAKEIGRRFGVTTALVALACSGVLLLLVSSYLM